MVVCTDLKLLQFYMFWSKKAKTNKFSNKSSLEGKLLEV